MRTFGPGSIASILKIALDVAYFILWAAFVFMVIAAAASIIALPFVGPGHGHIEIDGHVLNIIRRSPAPQAAVLCIAAYLALLLVIVNRLRLVFSTLILGDPFRPENVRRLRAVGLSLIGLQLVGYGLAAALAFALPDRAVGADLSLNLSGWFAILVVFVLAEVFREGARLRRDAELTI